MENHNKIICGFPGVGKTYLCEAGSGKYDFYDSDSSIFSWLDHPGGIRNPEFPENYIKHILSIYHQVSEIPKAIFVSTHADVRKALLNHNIPHTIVYPTHECKEEYIQRYISRGSSQEFVDMMRNNYDVFVTEIENEIMNEMTSRTMNECSAAYVILGKNQTLYDVLGNIFEFID